MHTVFENRQKFLLEFTNSIFLDFFQERKAKKFEPEASHICRRRRYCECSLKAAFWHENSNMLISSNVARFARNVTKRNFFVGYFFLPFADHDFLTLCNVL